MGSVPAEHTPSCALKWKARHRGMKGLQCHLLQAHKARLCAPAPHPSDGRSLCTRPQKGSLFHLCHSSGHITPHGPQHQFRTAPGSLPASSVSLRKPSSPCLPEWPSAQSLCAQGHPPGAGDSAQPAVPNPTRVFSQAPDRVPQRDATPLRLCLGCSFAYIPIPKPTCSKPVPTASFE